MRPSFSSVASAWATSPAVHQVSLATGQEHFVIDGGVMSLIRTGQYQGYLLVQRHIIVFWHNG